MTNEQKIREAFDKQYNFLTDYEKDEQYPVFKAGYFTYYYEIQTYRLPEGVTRCY